MTEAARKLGYLPNSAARSLTTRRTDTIGVVVQELINPFYPELVEILHDELHLAGYRTVLLSERSGEEILSQLRGRSVDGVVFTSATRDATFVEDLAHHGIPVVLLNREVEGVEIDSVASDNLMGGKLVAELLLGLGHRRIAHIAGPEAASTARDRERGFRETLYREGSPLHEDLRRFGGFSHHSGYQWCRDLMRLEIPPTAIFCANDVIAFGALDAAKQMGLAVPERLSIVGYDDIAMAGWRSFGLTTVRQPSGLMARAAARRLVELLQTEDPTLTSPQRQVFPVSLVQRETTGPPHTVQSIESA